MLSVWAELIANVAGDWLHNRLNRDIFTKRHATTVIYRLTVRTLPDGLETQFTSPDMTHVVSGGLCELSIVYITTIPTARPDLTELSCRRRVGQNGIADSLQKSGAV